MDQSKPKDGFASIASAATAARRLSSPAGSAVIPRETRKPPVRRPPLRFGSSSASSIAPGLLIAIEAAKGGLGSQQGEITMANIGSFKKSGNDYSGSITTLSLQAKNVRIVPEETRANDNAPSHRVYTGKVDYAV
jgi:hypothetical protein